MKTRTITSEVTGTVWKVVARVGDPVVVDQELVILESMKMEIPAAATVQGTVSRILVSEGDLVEEGHELVVIELRQVG